MVPESINRLHEIAREVEDKKQAMLGTTVEAAMICNPSSVQSPTSSLPSPSSGLPPTVGR